MYSSIKFPTALVAKSKMVLVAAFETILNQFLTRYDGGSEECDWRLRATAILFGMMIHSTRYFVLMLISIPDRLNITRSMVDGRFIRQGVWDTADCEV